MICMERQIDGLTQLYDHVCMSNLACVALVSCQRLEMGTLVL